jgi:hypothetical protein
LSYTKKVVNNLERAVTRQPKPVETRMIIDENAIHYAKYSALTTSPKSGAPIMQFGYPMR